MLDKQTNLNILFNKKMLSHLKKIAEEKKTSVRKLIKKAIETTYPSENIYKIRKKAFEKTLKIRPPVSKTPIDYKELINYGRKY